MKKRLTTKIFYFLMITSIFSILLNCYSVQASTNIIDNHITESELQQNSKLSLSSEEKIIKYDAKTGKDTVVDMSKIMQQNNLKKATSDSSISEINIPGYSPVSEKYLDGSTFIQPRAMLNSFFSRVGEQTLTPYRAICKIKTNNGDGTGFLVAPTLMLTAAHVIYDEENNNEMRTFVVCPLYSNGNYNPDDTLLGIQCGWQAIYRSSYWLETHDRQYDWALVELDQNMGSVIGWSGSTYYQNGSDMLNQPVKMLGYPEHLDSGEYLYYTQGEIEEVYDLHFMTSMGVREGMSGGPAYINTPEEYSNAVGIISGYLTQFPIDKGYMVRYTEYIMNLILSYF